MLKRLTYAEPHLRHRELAQQLAKECLADPDGRYHTLALAYLHTEQMLAAYRRDAARHAVRNQMHQDDRDAAP